MDTCKDTVIDDIYQAALDASVLPRMFAGIGRLVGSAQGCVLILGESNVMSHTLNFDERVLGLYNTVYGGQDPWHLAARRQGKLYEVVTGHELLPTHEFEHTDYYNDINRPLRIHDCLATTLDRDAATAITFHRSKQAPLFSNADKAALTRLRPHLRRMVWLRRRFEQHLINNTLPIQTLDFLTFGIVLVRGDGGIVFVNRAAYRILARRDGISVRCNRLVTVDPAAQDPLMKRLKLALGAAGQPVAGAEIAVDAGLGHSLAETAKKRGIAEGTARWHLKNAEHKTGMRKLSQLANLIAQLARRVDDGSG